jgi:hypothetical protein
MSSITDPPPPAMPEVGARPPDLGSGSGLTTFICGQGRESVPSGCLDDPSAVDQLIERLETAGPSAVVEVDDTVLGLTPERLLVVADLIVAVAGLVILRVGESAFRTAVEVVAALVRYDTSNAARSAAGRQLLLDAVALETPDSQVGGQQLADCLRRCGFRGGRVADLIAEHRRRRAELSRRVTQVGEGQALSAALPDAPSTAGLVVPEQYAIGRSGVTRHGLTIIPVAICPVGIGRDERRGVETVTLCFWDGRQYRLLTADREDIADRRRIVALARSGVPITSEIAAGVVQYLADFLQANITLLPVEAVTDRLGMHAGGFLYGERFIAPTAASESVGSVKFRGGDVGDVQIARGHHTRGTMDGWHGVLELARPHPRLMFLLWAAFVPALMAFFRISNFVVSLAGPTSRGKTTGVRVGASVWGCPDDGAEHTVIHSFNSTAVFRDRLAAVSCHHPVFLDDTQHVSDPREVTRTVYGVTQGHARSRGTPGGIAAQPQLHTVLFITGEQPATTMGSQDGGATARILEFWDSPFSGEVDPRLPAELNRLVCDHYGHAAPAVVQFLLDNAHRLEDWQSRLERFKAEYERLAGANGVAARQASHLAAVRLAAEIAHEALGLPGSPPDPVEPVYADLVTGTAEADRARTAMMHVLDWAAANRQFFCRSDGVSSLDRNRPPHDGWYGRWELDESVGIGRSRSPSPRWLGVVRGQLERTLGGAGFNTNAVLRVWRDRGWTACDEGRTDRVMKLEGQQCRMVVIPLATLQSFYPDRADPVEREAATSPVN